MMKYTELLSKSFVGAKTSAPTIDEMKQEFKSAIDDAVDKIRESTSVVQPIPSYEQIGTMINAAVKNAAQEIIPTQVTAKPDAEFTDTVKQMMQIMKELAEKDNSAPKNFDSYSLNDDQIAFILSLLLRYQDKYFKDIPLARALKQDFVWNIPVEVYDAAVTAETYGYPDQLNPIFWFYILCTEVPHDMIGLFVLRAYTSMDDEDFDCIDKHANEYKKAYLESDNDENDTGVSSIESFDPEIDVEELS